MADTDVLFEFVRIGRQMRISAIHAGSGIEVVVLTPISITQYQMQQLALIKLRKKMAEQDKPGSAKLF